MSVSLPISFPLFERVSEFLETRDLSRCGAVCSSLKQFTEVAFIWERQSEKEGIPLVNGQERNRKKDFQTLYPITQTCRLLGKLKGGIPLISEVFLEILDIPDPFDPKKRIRDNYRFVVVPHLIERTVDMETENALSGVTENVIPLSLKNLKVLSSHPLDGKQHTPVFYSGSLSEAFEQCGKAAEKVSVFFIRRCMVEETKGLRWKDQRTLIEGALGFEAVSLHTRAFMDVIDILETGTCPDSQFVRTPDTLNSNLVIGGYSPDVGVRIHYGVYGFKKIGCVPCISAEA